MSLYITDECINCGACEDTCPTGAISENAEQSIRVIDPTRCTECVGFYDRTMCQIECPVECCVSDPKRHETTGQLMTKAHKLFPDYNFAHGNSVDTDNGEAGGESRQHRRSA